ncbi:MAG: ATPase, T2SS/T4P/T4SS family [Nitrospirota bacterium]|nr:ATPase, T2SS/T4P/T4SS family [Nitrospirota bacterium]
MIVRSGGNKRRKPLGERLVESGQITAQQLRFALQEQSRTGRLLGEILIANNFTSESAIASMVTMQAGDSYDDLTDIEVPREVLQLLPETFIRKRHVLPLWTDNESIRVAMVDTFDVEAIDDVARVTNRDVVVVGCPRSAFLDLVRRLFDSAEARSSRFEGAVKNAARSISDLAEGDQTAIITLVNEIITRGVLMGATDIHIQPEEAVVHIRYRVDGVMREGDTIPKEVQAAVESRLKVMARLDISEKRIPQDGRIEQQIEGRCIDLRISTVPALAGENIVLRLLDRAKVAVRLEELGLTPAHRQMFREAVSRPHGLILMTGPTGSGKTTTLYSGLMEINALERNVMTLEDPVEYRMSVIRQTQVNAKAGYTFATGLRALLRQDPDVILVGEMRDPETSDLAIRASMTGHLVLSTLHTNDASSALPRLIDMGVAPYLLPSTLIAVVAQRLVRRPCKHCMRPYTPAVEEFESFSREPHEGNFVTVEGCNRCYGTGYSGQLPLVEFLNMNQEVGELVMARASAADIYQAAMASGMRDLRMDGYEKAVQGLTTLAEVQRVAERRLAVRTGHAPERNKG